MTFNDTICLPASTTLKVRETLKRAVKSFIIYFPCQVEWCKALKTGRAVFQIAYEKLYHHVEQNGMHSFHEYIANVTVDSESDNESKTDESSTSQSKDEIDE